MKKTSIRILLSCFFVLSFVTVQKVHAQFDAQFSQYWAVTNYYNPAYAGQTDKLNVTAAYSQQLSGFDNAPKTTYFAADCPFKVMGLKQGAGLIFSNDQLGFFTNQTLGLQYSVKLKFLNGQIGLGGQVGIVSIGFDPSKVTMYDESTGTVVSGTNSDELVPTSKVSGTKLDAALGAFYTHRLFYTGVSVTHFLSPVINWGETNQFEVSPVYYFTGGSNIKTNSPFLTLQPSFLVKSDFTDYKLDLSCRGTYVWNGKEFLAGVSYSPSTSATFMIGAMMKNVRLTYSYELFTNGIGAASGSHDLVLGYSMDMNFGQKAKNKHKSVRIL